MARKCSRWKGSRCGRRPNTKWATRGITAAPDRAMSSHRRSLLALVPITPAPRGNGLAMRVWSWISAAARHHDVAVAVVPIAGHLDEDSNLPPEVALRTLAVNASVMDVLNAFQGPLPDAVLAARLGLVSLAAAVATAADLPLLVDLDEDD